MTTETNKRTATAADLAALAAELDSLLTVADLAKLLGRSEGQIRQWRLKGVLPDPIKLAGGGIRWTRSSIEEFIESQLAPKSTLPRENTKMMTYETTPLSSYTISAKTVTTEVVARDQGGQVKWMREGEFFQTLTNSSDTLQYVVLAHQVISLAQKDIAGEATHEDFQKSCVCRNGNGLFVFQSFEAAEAAAEYVGSALCDVDVFTHDGNSSPSPVSSINIAWKCVVRRVAPGDTILFHNYLFDAVNGAGLPSTESHE